MYQLIFYVPQTHLDSVKDALFAAGAGAFGNYDCCAWQSVGVGQFRPLQGSQPYLGSTHVVQQVIEYKVEMVCVDECIQEVVNTLKQVHPYEQPAYSVWRINTF